MYGLKAAAIAVYPMYRGLARLVGMDVLSTGKTLTDQFATVREHFCKVTNVDCSERFDWRP